MDSAKVLKKFGWKKGHGLGRQEQGMLEPLKASMKSGRGGIGFDPAEEFSDHWWSTLYNKTAKNIVIENSKDGVVMRSGGKHTKRGYRSSRVQRDKLCYGGFLQSKVIARDGKLVSLKQPEEEEEEDDRSRMVPLLTDDQLLVACGGRTAHKAARHGLTLNGKLHRIELQERRLLGVQEEEEEEAVMEKTVKGEQKKKVMARKRKEEVEEVEEEDDLLKRSRRKRRTEMCTKSKHKKRKNSQK